MKTFGSLFNTPFSANDIAYDAQNGFYFAAEAERGMIWYLAWVISEEGCYYEKNHLAGKEPRNGANAYIL